MKTYLRENKIHGTRLFPFQHYKAINHGNGIFVPCHWHPEIEITYVISGTIILSLDSISHTLSAGDICFANSGVLHQAESASEDAAYYSYVFSMDSLDFLLEDSSQMHYIKPLKSACRFPALLNQSTSEYTEILPHVKELIHCNENRTPAFELLTKASLYKIISCFYENGLIEKSPKKEIPSSRAEDIRTLLLYMQEHYTEHIYLEDAAHLLHMSPKYFCTYFKTVFGKNFTTYLNHLRIEQACLLLTTTSLSVMEISFETGFENFSYFIKTFKNIMGCTPKKYRDQT